MNSASLPMRDTYVVKVIRRALLAIFLIGVTGTGTELLLLEHTEGPWQWTPLALLMISMLSIAWVLAMPGRSAIRFLQGAMLLCLLSGFVGLWLHYKGNVEFELEMYPDLNGLNLFREAIMGATPTLASGTMIEIGLVGLLYTYHHPATGSESGEQLPEGDN